jgi:hypothetical protein
VTPLGGDIKSVTAVCLRLCHAKEIDGRATLTDFDERMEIYLSLRGLVHRSHSAGLHMRRRQTI